MRDGIGEDEFVRLREARDATLGTPKLLIPSIQVNMRAGNLPPPEDNGTRYLKVPINVIGRQGTGLTGYANPSGGIPPEPR